MTEYMEAQNVHFNKRCDYLNHIARHRDPLSFLNAVLLDGNSPAVESMKKMLVEDGYKYRLVNTAGSILNKSRLNIVYLIPYLEISRDNEILVWQSHMLSRLGHNVSLFSHFLMPGCTKCLNPYITISPQNNLYDLVPPCDAVIAGDWDNVADIVKINAPVKVLFLHGSIDAVDNYEELPNSLKSAVSTAFTLPVRIITTSKETQKRLKNLFGRESVAILDTAAEGSVPADTKSFSWRKSVFRLDRELKSLARCNIQAVKC